MLNHRSPVIFWAACHRQEFNPNESLRLKRAVLTPQQKVVIAVKRFRNTEREKELERNWKKTEEINKKQS